MNRAPAPLRPPGRALAVLLLLAALAHPGVVARGALAAGAAAATDSATADLATADLATADLATADLALRLFEHGPSVEPPASRVVVASYNIKFGKKIDEALQEIRQDEYLRAADLLLLQEMDAVGVDRLARALGMNGVYAPASTDREGQGFGNAVLFRGPLADLRALHLPHRHPITGQVRVALFATARWRGGAVRVACVHLETPPLSLTSRLEQADAVLDALADSRLPLIVAGDFKFHHDPRGTGFRPPDARGGLCLDDCARPIRVNFYLR